MPHSDVFVHTNHHYKLRMFKTKPTFFDVIISIVSVLYPLSALPQAIRVFAGQTEGVAITSWVLFTVCAALFLIYGIKHKVYPMIVSNILWIIMDLVVVFGLVIAYIK